MGFVQQYQDVSSYSEIMGASEQRLLQLIFERLLLDLNQALEYGLNQDMVEKNRCIGHACDILNHLIRNISTDDEPEAAKNVCEIYFAMLTELIAAYKNSDEGLSILKSSIRTVSNLKKALDALANE